MTRVREDPRGTRRPGSSAAPSATPPRPAGRSTSTSPAPIRAARRTRFARRFGGAAVPAVGAPRRLARRRRRGRSETVDFTPLAGRASTPISRHATSRSTRSRCASAAASALDPHGGRGGPRARASCGRSPTRSSATIRCGSCARSASRTSSGSAWTSTPRGSCARRRTSSTEPAGERILGELRRCPPRAFAGSTSSGCSSRSAGRSTGRSRRSTIADFRLVAVFGERLTALPISTRAAALRGRAAPARGRPRTPRRAAIHRFRRATEPWALDALAFVGASELAGGGRGRAARRSGGAARARRRAGARARPRDRAYPRGHRRGAGSGDDLDARAGARARARAREAERRRVSLELRLALQEERAADLAERVRRLLGPFSGTEVALDSGCGTGSLAFALAPHVAEVVGVDTRADYLEAGASARPRTSASSRATRWRFRSATRSSTSRAATASSITSAARSSRSPSSRA